MSASTRRPGKAWFGPKQIGFGISPKTWQGWLIVVGGAAALVVVVRVLGG